MSDLTFGIAMLAVALVSAGSIGFLVTSDEFTEIKLGAALGLSMVSFILGVGSVLKSGKGMLLSDKALVKGKQYATVCTGKSAEREVAILEDAEGIKAHELSKKPPRLFYYTGDPKNPYEEIKTMTTKEFAERMTKIMELLKKAQEKKALQKSTTTQNGHWAVFLLRVCHLPHTGDPVKRL